jgi:hypothetical protein
LSSSQPQVRRWPSSHRWTILAVLARAFLTITTATQRAETHPAPGLIAFTANEIRHLFTQLLDHTHRDIAHLLCFATFRNLSIPHAQLAGFPGG